MKSWQYKTTVMLGVVCVGLSAAIVITSKSNMGIQDNIQARQMQLNNSVLGQQAQQITGNILQDMAATASKNENMRKLLAKYGYTIQSAAQPATTKKTTETKVEEIKTIETKAPATKTTEEK